MVSQTLDITEQYVNGYEGNYFALDVSEWQNVTVQVIGSFGGGTIDIKGTNNSGAIQGILEGNPQSSKDYVAILAINLTDDSRVSQISSAGLYKVVVSTKFISLSNGSLDANSKIILFLNKPF